MVDQSAVLLASIHSDWADSEITFPKQMQKCIENTITKARVIVTRLQSHPAYDAVFTFAAPVSHDVWAAMTPDSFKLIRPRVKVPRELGFQYESIRKNAFDEIKPQDRILITGFGNGAMAHLFAFDVAIHRPHIAIHCVSFGRVRPGCRTFAKLYRERVPASVHADHRRIFDIPVRFRHVGQSWILPPKWSLNPNEYVREVRKRQTVRIGKPAGFLERIGCRLSRTLSGTPIQRSPNTSFVRSSEAVTLKMVSIDASFIGATTG